MTSSHSDDDLFTPTLTETDDAVEFDRPWNPWSLVTLTFFFGLVAGGGLLALNFRRLGIRGRLYPALAVVGVVVAASAAFLAWLAASGGISLQNEQAKDTARWIRK